MAFFGAEVSAGKTTWINASPEVSLRLTNACLFKRAKKKDARIVLEVCDDADANEEDKPLKIAVGVFSSAVSDNITLEVLVTSKMGLRLSGPDVAGAVVHVIGNELESENEMPMEFPDLAGMNDFGFESEDSDEDQDDESSEEDSDEDENDAEESQTANGKGAMVVKRKAGALPVITHKTGLKFQDIVIGSGKKVVSGHNVALQYTLRLENGKVVDRADRKRPFKFRLGIGECIKGFDIGVMGMREGGERHLIVPPKLGYGSQPPPGIPRNATLYFDVIVCKAF